MACEYLGLEWCILFLHTLEALFSLHFHNLEFLFCAQKIHENMH